MVPSERSRPEARSRRMMGVSVSLTKTPSNSGTSPVKQQSASRGADHGQALRLAEPVVVLAEAGGDVDDAGALAGGDEVGGHDAEGAPVGEAGEVVEEGLVAQPEEIVHGDGGHLGDLAVVPAEDAVHEGSGQDQPLPVGGGDAHVVDVAAHGQGHVGGQGPRGRGPGEQGQARLAGHRKTDRDRRVLGLPVALVHLEVRQRRRAPGAVGEGLVSLVDQALVPQRLEHPPHRLHEAGVHRPVLIVPVDPAAQPLDQVSPLRRVAQDQVPAGLVEPGHPVLEDVPPRSETELLLRLVLHRQAVAVPAPAALDPVAAHRPVAGHHVLGDRGEQVPVVRQARGEGRAVVEPEGAPGWPGQDGLAVQVSLAPELEDAALLGGKVDLARHLVEGRRRRGAWGGGGHRRRFLREELHDLDQQDQHQGREVEPGGPHEPRDVAAQSVEGRVGEPAQGSARDGCAGRG